MAVYHWAIVILIVLNWFTYSYPDSAGKLVGPVWDRVNEFIGDISLFESSEGCSDDYNPICGSDGVTYNNLCLAQLNNITEFTSGEC